MSDAPHLTPRDRAIVQALVQKVRLFSQRQIVDHWWNGELANSRRRLKRLADRKLLHRIVVMARPAPAFESPLIIWRPGDVAPNFGKIAYRCSARWRSRPARQCVVWLETGRCGTELWQDRLPLLSTLAVSTSQTVCGLVGDRTGISGLRRHSPR